jgi:hypothetical protein
VKFFCRLKSEMEVASEERRGVVCDFSGDAIQNGQSTLITVRKPLFGKLKLKDGPTSLEVFSLVVRKGNRFFAAPFVVNGDL